MFWCVQLTGGISKGLAMLTLDQDYISRFRNQPMTYQQRLIYALQALGVGVYEGIIGPLPFCLLLLLPSLCIRGRQHASQLAGQPWSSHSHCSLT